MKEFVKEEHFMSKPIKKRNMLKPKKGFVMAQLNIDKLTPLQWDGIMRAMDAYAEHYHEYKVNEFSKGAVSCELCPRCNSQLIYKRQYTEGYSCNNCFHDWA